MIKDNLLPNISRKWNCCINASKGNRKKQLTSRSSHIDDCAVYNINSNYLGKIEKAELYTVYICIVQPLIEFLFNKFLWK